MKCIRFVKWTIIILGMWLCRTGPALADRPADFIRQMNLGKAHLENRNAAKAVEAYRAAVRIDPTSAPALRNLARGHLLARKSALAIETLGKAAGLRPDAPATSYLTGLAHARLSQFEQAIPHFEKAARLDPNTAALRFQLAHAYQAFGKHERAAEQLRETVRLDPLHASAHYKLASYARKAGDKAAFQREYREFMRLRKLFGDAARSAAALELCVYTQPEAAVTGETARRARPPQQTIAVRFTDATARVFAEGEDRAAAAAVWDVDDQGRCTVLVAEADGRWGVLTWSPAGTFRRVRVEAKPLITADVEGCIVGNFHDDIPKGTRFDPTIHAHNDVLLFGAHGVRLLKGGGEHGFRDVTEAAGLAGRTAKRACWVDYEHDGDLDLLFACEAGLELWQNNGNGRFTQVTSDVGIGRTGPVSDVAAADLDADVAVDIVAARGAGSTLVFENRRVGRFAPMPEPPAPWPAARRVLVNDLNNDGNIDAVLIADRQAIAMLGLSARRVRFDLSQIAARGGVLVDYDNDGWLDLVVFGRQRAETANGSVRLWRNTGTDNWTDVTDATGLASIALPEVRDVIAADVDADGDTDLFVLTAGGRLRLLRNEGGHVNGQLKVRLVPLKTNQSGIGTRVELRKDTFWAVREVGRIPIEIGLGGRSRLDSLQIVWTNGVVDNQIDLAPKPRPVTIKEKNVATGSCPFLYAWDGRGYRFVTDILGNAPVGLSLRRGVVLPADPDEFVYVGEAASFPPRSGRYDLKITDEFREVLYLDDVRLVAVDHDPRVEVHPTDKIMPPPFPPSALWALGDPRSPITAMGDDGVDRTEAVRAIDGVFAPPGPVLPPPLRGTCEPMSLTLDFGEVEPSRPLVLALTGWLQYGDASTNIALSQNADRTIIPPTLEAETADGQWSRVDLVVGMPAGKTKTILCDLADRLPPETRRLRLTTTFEIRWDRIALFVRRTDAVRRRHALSPIVADLRWRGFSELAFRAPGHPSTPDHDIVSDRPTWRTTPQGWCTRYGDVLELVTRRDGKLVILNAGDALSLAFDAAALPPVPDGMIRGFFFYSVGWDKDEDHNVITGETVEPLPVEDATVAIPDEGEDPDDGADWRLKYNTRFVPHDRFAPGA